MTFGEFNLTMMTHPVLGRLLPLECRRTYPRLELEGNKLCASFVGFRLQPVQNGMEVRDPSYYLKITYPQCSVRAFVKFAQEKPQGHLMAQQTPETLRKLMESCDKVLQCYDEEAQTLEAAVAQYNALLDSILEPEQLAVLDKMEKIIG